MSEPHPRVGVAAIVINPQNQLLVGVRKGSHGAGTWQLPGGHLEYGEDILRCAERETDEETGLRVNATQIAHLTNVVFEKDVKHYITLFVHCDMASSDAEPQIMEPEKCAGWYWKSWEELMALRGDSAPGDVFFLPLHYLLDRVKGVEELRGEPGRMSS